MTKPGEDIFLGSLGNMHRNGDSPITHFFSALHDIDDNNQHAEDACKTQTTEAIGQLAAGFAHRFNNFLTVIYCNSQLLLERNGNFDSESKDLTERTLAASRYAADLVRQLVDFSQRQVIDIQALDLHQLVESNLRVIRGSAARNIKWENHSCTGLPLVLADGEMLGRVISHVLVNAVDAMPQGGRITLTTETIVVTLTEISNHPAARAGKFVCLTICDTGCGIPPTDLPRIFDPFFTTKDSDRSGLGLALVHGIIKQHHGWTQVTSQIDKGTTFKIFLPAIPDIVAVGPTALFEHEPQPIC